MIKAVCVVTMTTILCSSAAHGWCTDCEPDVYISEYYRALQDRQIDINEATRTLEEDIATIGVPDICMPYDEFCLPLVEDLDAAIERNCELTAKVRKDMREQFDWYYDNRPVADRLADCIAWELTCGGGDPNVCE